jgi:O-antigen ligase
MLILAIVALFYPEFAIILFLTTPLFKLFLKLIAPITREYDITAVVMIILALSLSLHMIRFGKGVIKWPGTMIAMLFALLGVLLFSYTFTPTPNYGYEKLSRSLIALPIGLLAPIIYLRTEKQATRLLFYLLITGIFVAFGTIFSSGPTYETLTGRSTFLESNPLSTASTINFGLVVAIVWLFNKWGNKLFRFLLIAVIPILFLGIFYSGSRGPLVGIALAILFFLFSERHALQIRHYILISLLFIIGIIVVSSYLPEDHWRRFTFLTGNPSDAHFTSGRPELWLAALKGGLTAPIFGNGIGSYGYVTGGGDIRAYPHNMFLELFCEQGLIGMILGIIVIIIPFQLGFRQIRLLKGTQHGITAMTFFLIFFVSFIDAMKSGDLSDNRRMWFFMGCIFGFENIIANYNLSANPMYSDQNIEPPYLMAGYDYSSQNQY